MATMTLAEKETSQRVCEALGTAACALLSWACILFELEDAATCRFGVFQYATDYSFVGLLVLLSYASAFLALDHWWLKYFAANASELRPNWLLIPFIGAFFSYFNVFVAWPPLTGICAEYYAPGLVDAGFFGLTGGLFGVLLMFCFWAFGFVMRYTRNRF